MGKAEVGAHRSGYEPWQCSGHIMSVLFEGELHQVDHQSWVIFPNFHKKKTHSG